MSQNILLVDDDKTILNVLLLLLENAGHSIFTASNAIEAVDILKRKADEIDLIISDVNMPGMSGLELADIARKQYPDLPVILSSGNNYRQEAYRLGAGFIGKPFPVNNLLEMISTIYPPS